MGKDEARLQKSNSQLLLERLSESQKKPKKTPQAKPLADGENSLETTLISFELDTDTLHEVFDRRDINMFCETFGDVSQVATKLKSDPQQGIAQNSVEARCSAFGQNTLPVVPPPSFLHCFWDACMDLTIQILFVAAIVSIVFGLTLPDPYTEKVERSTGWINGTAIIATILVVTLTASINDYQKGRKFAELEVAQAIKDVSLVRDGQACGVVVNEVVVGDVMHAEAGMELCADALLLSGNHFKTNESSVTGESALIQKNAEKDPFFLSGTTIEEGSGLLLVVAVGVSSVRGRLKTAIMSSSRSATPLQRHLDQLAKWIGILGLALAGMLVIALSIKQGVRISQDKVDANVTDFLNYIILAAALVAVAIPEGLPLAVAISLAFSMKAMMRDHCLVRILASCETMGAATAVCSDKTGTLTTNHMTLVQGFIAGEEFVLQGYGLTLPASPKTDQQKRIVTSGPRDTFTFQYLTPDTLQRFAFACRVNCTAHQVTTTQHHSEDSSEHSKEVIDKRWVGSHTETALLKFIQKVLVHSTAVNEEMLDAQIAAAMEVPDETFRQYPFDSTKKRMITLVASHHDGLSRTTEQGGSTLYGKGASEVMLSLCDRVQEADGSVSLLTPTRRAFISQMLQEMADQGNRTLGIAFCEDGPSLLHGFPTEEPDPPPSILLGIVGLQDPIREEVPLAIAECARASLRVRMITGDHLSTALAIAHKAGIYREHEGDLALTGSEFCERLAEDPSRMIAELPFVRVLARSTPHDKLEFVRLLKEEVGEVVGVTGDGTNDAPALKLADVGFAMQTSTDIARSASDMVLLDDNFATVVTAIRWGRCVNDCVRKFIQYQLAVNVAGVGLTVIGSLVSSRGKEPISPVQLLWLNLIMDTLAALCLATERPEQACLSRRPTFKQAPIMTRRMLAFIGVHGAYQLSLILVLLFLGAPFFHTIEGESEGCGRNNLSAHTTPTLGHCNALCTNQGGSLYKNTRYCQQGLIHSTILFNTFIWFQIFNMFNARKLRRELNPFEGLWTRSKPMLCLLSLIVALQVLAVEVGGEVIQTTRLDGIQWAACIGFGLVEFPLGLLLRLLPFEDWEPPQVPAEDPKRGERLLQELLSANSEDMS